MSESQSVENYLGKAVLTKIENLESGSNRINQLALSEYDTLARTEIYTHTHREFQNSTRNRNPEVILNPSKFVFTM